MKEETRRFTITRMDSADKGLSSYIGSYASNFSAGSFGGGNNSFFRIPSSNSGSYSPKDTILDGADLENNSTNVNISGAARSRAISAPPIDVELVMKSLDHVNNFAKRRQIDKLPPVLMYEIGCNGESCYANITLRELLQLVNDEAYEIDKAEGCERFKRHDSELLLERQGESLQERNTTEKVFQTRAPKRYAMDDNSIHSTGKAENKAPFQSKSSRRAHASETGKSQTTGSILEEESYDVTGELRLRDLRRLDFLFNPIEERSVLIRRHAVLFAMVSMT
jgi:hypothetical protein